MALDRDETILRCYLALVQSGRSIGAVDDAVEMADALLARLRPEAVAPAPSLPAIVGEVGTVSALPVDAAKDAPRAPYVPKVGDVVGIDGGKQYGETRVVTGIDRGDVSYVRLNTNGGVICRHTIPLSDLTYLRLATAAERVAAGLPPEAGVVASVPSVPTHKDAAPASKEPVTGDSRPVAVVAFNEAKEREGLARAVNEAHKSWLHDIKDERGILDMCIDAAIAFMAKRGAS